MVSIVIKISQSKVYKKLVIKNNAYFISFTIFYENINTLMYKVIGAVIYNIIDEYICLDCLVLL